MNRTCVIACVWLIAIAASPAEAQKPEPGDCSKPTHAVREIVGQMVEVRDGVRLSVEDTGIGIDAGFSCAAT